jgi:hypothetical protein
MPLPPWDPSSSDGCSVPEPLKQFFPNTPAVRAVCVRHDARYYRGGTREDRLIADAIFLRDLVEAGVNAETAEKMFTGVRMFGGPSGRQKYSWAFGGQRFVYDPSR